VPLDDVLGPGFALVTDGPVGRELRERAHAVGAREITADGIVDEGGMLQAWLRAGRTAGALLRPDRIVMATDRS
jgi:hypothetical protein